MKEEDHSDAGLADWEAGPFLAHVMRILPSIVYIFNQDTQSNEYSNRSVAEAMGYTEQEIRAFGSNFMSLLCHPDDLPNVLQHFKSISRLADGEIISVEYRMRHKEDRWVWFVSFDTVFERHSDGRVMRHIGVAADITPLKESEERALAASEDAAVANEDLRAFAYSISHDMKSPLNTLHLLLAELEQSHSIDLNSDARELLGHARTTVTNMQNRIERVLDYTRMIDRKAAIQPVEMNEAIESVLSDLSAEIAATDAQIVIDDLPMVSGSKEEIKVLFQNLISNALKFREQGAAPHIRIFDTTDQSEKAVRITVADDGIGIPADSHERIFGMFKRLHSEKSFVGSGLGLAICRRIAISHGGELSVKSSPGNGAAFTVRLRP